MMKKYFLLLVCCLATLPCWAGGFQVSLQGQKQIGMSHVGAALPIDGSAVYFNPGALSFVGGTHVNLGFSPIFANVQYLQPSTGATSAKEFSVGTPFSAYITSALAKEGALSNLSVGIGVYTPFGSSIAYPEDLIGRFVTKSVSLKTIFIQPTVSCKFLDNKLGIGVGVVYGTGDFKIVRAVPLYDAQGNESEAELSGKGSGIGFNVGVYAQPIDKLGLGITYRTGTKVSIKDGDASFSVPSVVSPLFNANSFDLDVSLPSTLSIGISYFMNEAKTTFVSAQIDQTGWKSYKELRFVFPEGQTVGGEKELVSTRNYQGNWMFRVGAQVAVNEKLQVRAGGYYDTSAIPDLDTEHNGIPEAYVTPETPDANRGGFSLGASYQVTSKLGVDASFMYVNGQERLTYNPEEQFEQQYKATAVIPGIGINLKF